MIIRSVYSPEIPGFVGLATLHIQLERNCKSVSEVCENFREENSSLRWLLKTHTVVFNAVTNHETAMSGS